MILIRPTLLGHQGLRLSLTPLTLLSFLTVEEVLLLLVRLTLGLLNLEDQRAQGLPVQRVG
jgi:hypothetical protein